MVRKLFSRENAAPRRPRLGAALLLARVLPLLPLVLALVWWQGQHFAAQAKQSKQDPVTRTALWLYDSALRAWSASPERQAVDPRIVVVGLDERSLQQTGRWPWPREQTAQLIDQLFEHYQIRLLGVDMIFAEPQTTNAASGASASLPPTEPPKLSASDTRLVQSLQGRDVVLSFYLTHDAQQTGALHAPWIARGEGALNPEQSERFTGFVSSLPSMVRAVGAVGTVDTANAEGATNKTDQLTQAGSPNAGLGGSGFINAHADVDGLHRRIPLVLHALPSASGNPSHSQAQSGLQPSLSLAMLHRLTGQPHARWLPQGLELTGRTSPAGSHDTPNSSRLSGSAGSSHSSSPANKPNTTASEAHRLFIPLEPGGLLPLAFRGNPGLTTAAFEHISASDVLRGQIAPERLRGKVVLLGATAAGLGDLRATPLHSLQPGVELHALALANMLDSAYLQTPPYPAATELALLLATSGLLLWLLPRLSRRSSLLSLAAVLGLCGAYVGAYRWAFTQGWVLPIASSVLLAAMLYVVHTALGFWRESRLRAQLAGVLRRYAPAALVGDSEQLQLPSQGVQTRELTVMFCDIRGFTELSSQLDPQQLLRLTQAVFERITACVHQSGGMVDKYLGDSVMAFWGHEAPASQATALGNTQVRATSATHHAQQAVNGALAILQELAAWRSQNEDVAGMRSQIAQTMRVGIGINTGAMLVGDIGTRERASFSVMGDAVNVAARLQELTRQYEGVDLLVGAATAHGAAAQRWHSLGPINLRGRSEAVEVFKLG